MKKLIYIAGGGTGGHIYPGIAIAKELLRQNPDLKIEFVGGETGLEHKIVPREGFRLHHIKGGKLNFAGNFGLKIKTLLKIPIGLLQSLALLLNTRPHFVLGVGGYASGPFVLVASLLGIPTGLWEPNAHPGLANRWLSRFVGVCYVVFADANKWLKNKSIYVFGMPVRAEIEKAGALSFEELQKLRPASGQNHFHLLSFGGSQGSRAISTVLVKALTDPAHSGDKNWTQGLKVVHQIGATDFPVVKPKYEGFETWVTPLEFIFDMPSYYAQADLVLVRGGASTLVEVAAFGVVPIVVPLPAADDHQLRNAEVLEKAAAAKIILQQNLTPQSLTMAVQELRQNPELRRKMAQNLKALFKPLAAQQIATDILKRMS
jgi:UDP-N-acetylglucosamine--N-acetylmuramyl-(pentapeptide) pyrophosphoryl-undecaprenol N-acetylglucosamine transferase